MPTNEKFEKMKQDLINENEKMFGAEIRAKYGNSTANKSNKNINSLTQQQYNENERLHSEIEIALKSALKTGDPSSEQAQKVCDLHRLWLSVFYPEYSKEYHSYLAEMYIADERFKAFYEKIAPGCTKFLHDAIKIYCA